MIAPSVDAARTHSSSGNSYSAAGASYDGLTRKPADPLKSALRAAAAKQIWAGFVLLLIGLAITGISMAIAPGGFFVVTYGAIAVGIFRIIGGFWKLITC